MSNVFSMLTFQNIKAYMSNVALVLMATTTTVVRLIYDYILLYYYSLQLCKTVKTEKKGQFLFLYRRIPIRIVNYKGNTITINTLCYFSYHPVSPSLFFLHLDTVYATDFIFHTSWWRHCANSGIVRSSSRRMYPGCLTAGMRID